MTQLEIKQELKDGLELGTIKFHHSSLRRGYLRKNDSNVFEIYHGRFGHGIILKCPNALDEYNHSNRYYTIHYFIYTNNYEKNNKTIFRHFGIS